MLYQILEKTPFSVQYYPSQPYRPIAEFQLQMAEYDLRLNKTHYYEHVVRVADCFLCPLEIAERIVAYWKERYPFAEYQLQKHAELERIQRLRTRGWRMPENTVYVGRPTQWGNQFHLSMAESLLSYSFNSHLAGLSNAEIVAKAYEASIMELIKKDVDERTRTLEDIDEKVYAFNRVFGMTFDEWIAPLRGKNLACWCSPDQPCHADVLLRLANTVCSGLPDATS